MSRDGARSNRAGATAQKALVKEEYMPDIVVRTHEGEEVDRIDINGKDERQIEKIERGLAINFDFDRFTFGVEE